MQKMREKTKLLWKEGGGEFIVGPFFFLDIVEVETTVIREGVVP